MLKPVADWLKSTWEWTKGNSDRLALLVAVGSILGSTVAWAGRMDSSAEGAYAETDKKSEAQSDVIEARFEAQDKLIETKLQERYQLIEAMLLQQNEMIEIKLRAQNEMIDANLQAPSEMKESMFQLLSNKIDDQIESMNLIRGEVKTALAAGSSGPGPSGIAAGERNQRASSAGVLAA